MEPEQVAAPVPDGGAISAPAQQQPRTLTADEEQASPEEQEAYDRFVGQAFNLVYDKGTLPKVVDMLGGEGDPIEGLARVSAMVISRVMSSAQEAGVKLSGDVLFHGAKEIFEDLAELSRQVQIKDFAADEDALEAAYFRALDALRMVLEGSGDINREAAQADLAQLEQMDEAGELEGFFRRLAEEDDGDGDGAEPEAKAEPETGAPPAAATTPPAETPPKRGNGLMPMGRA